jgi:thymidylate kinase
MKVLLLEGLDNVGKSTLAGELIARYKNKYNILFMHSRSPKPQEGVDPLTYQTAEFVTKADIVANIAKREISKDHPLSETLCIFDRSWLDEYVYGQIYRKESSLDVLNMIKLCFRCLTYEELVNNVDVAAVFLEAAPEFSIAKDDGKSFTSNIADYDKKLVQVVREKNLFLSVLNICDMMNLCKTVTVNVQDEDNYRPLDDIIKDLNKQLLSKGIEL